MVVNRKSKSKRRNGIVWMIVMEWILKSQSQLLGPLVSALLPEIISELWQGDEENEALLLLWLGVLNVLYIVREDCERNTGDGELNKIDLLGFPIESSGDKFRVNIKTLKESESVAVRRLIIYAVEMDDVKLFDWICRNFEVTGWDSLTAQDNDRDSEMDEKKEEFGYGLANLVLKASDKRIRMMPIRFLEARLKGSEEGRLKCVEWIRGRISMVQDETLVLKDWLNALSCDIETCLLCFKSWKLVDRSFSLLVCQVLLNDNLNTSEPPKRNIKVSTNHSTKASTRDRNKFDYELPGRQYWRVLEKLYVFCIRNATIEVNLKLQAVYFKWMALIAARIGLLAITNLGDLVPFLGSFYQCMDGVYDGVEVAAMEVPNGVKDFIALFKNTDYDSYVGFSKDFVGELEFINGCCGPAAYARNTAICRHLMGQLCEWANSDLRGKEIMKPLLSQ